MHSLHRRDPTFRAGTGKLTKQCSRPPTFRRSSRSSRCCRSTHSASHSASPPSCASSCASCASSSCASATTPTTAPPSSPLRSSESRLNAAVAAVVAGVTAAAQRQLPPALQAFEAKWNARRQRRQQPPLTDAAKRDLRNEASRRDAVQLRVAQDLQLRLAARNAPLASPALPTTRPGLSSKLTVRNDTLTCTTCGCKADRDYNGACSMLELGLHHAECGHQLSRPAYLDFDAPLPQATTAWIKQQRSAVWQEQQENAMRRFASAAHEWPQRAHAPDEHEQQELLDAAQWLHAEADRVQNMTHEQVLQFCLTNEQILHL